MDHFLKGIYVNKIHHLEDFYIPIDDEEKKHLIITGKNGSGKTSLLNAIIEYLQGVLDSANGLTTRFVELDDERQVFWKQIKQNQLKKELLNSEAQKLIKLSVHEKIVLDILDYEKMLKQVRHHDTLLAFYSAHRKPNFIEFKSPEKPDLSLTKIIKESKNSEFIKFLVDLKTQESFARNENQLDEANKIKRWFNDFNELLNRIFEGDKIELIFNYKNYSFTIKQGKKHFGFNQLADGYSAIIDIIADLILKMQEQDSLVRAYKKPGIVLIDEVETHLHLSLQKMILPMLTKIFPNIQFIVTTHSPFVVSSLENAVVFDLESKQKLENLTEYSYDALAEGFFKVSEESSYLHAKLKRYKTLSEKNINMDEADKAEFKMLDQQFSSLNEAIAPVNVIGQYRSIKLKMMS